MAIQKPEITGKHSE